MHKWSLILPVSIATLAVGGLLFEQFRYNATGRVRQKSLTSLNGTKYSIHPLVEILDYVFYPVTSLLGWLTLNNSNSVFNSLVVGGRFVNPFREWNDRNILDLFAYIRYRLTRVNRNCVPGEEVGLALI